MKKFFHISAVILILLSAVQLYSQQNQEQQQAEPENKMLFAYQRNFARGSLSTKVQVLQDAASREASGMGELYLQAIRFYLDNFHTLREDATAIELVKLASRLAGETQYKASTADLWKLFQRSNDIGIQVASVQSIGRLLEPDDQILTL